MKLLFAEDDPDLSRAVCALLAHSGYSVDPVFTGTDALLYAQSGSYDGLILDRMMPGMDGVEVLRRLRQEGNRVPCLILTARDAVDAFPPDEDLAQTIVVAYNPEKYLSKAARDFIEEAQEILQEE